MNFSDRLSRSHLDGSPFICLLRHAEVEAADGLKRYIGQTDLPLSALGRQHCREWAERLVSITLEKIVCSDLQRSLETAKLIANRRSISVQPLRNLREIDLGAWEGLSFETVKAHYPEEYNRRGAALATHRPPGGESFSDLAQRVLPVFYKIAGNASAPVLLVGHAGVNRVILSHLLEMPLEAMFRLGQDYGAMNVIIPRGEQYQVEGINLSL
jgi:alpha-ribazole phosphatase